MKNDCFIGRIWAHCFVCGLLFLGIRAACLSLAAETSLEEPELASSTRKRSGDVILGRYVYSRNCQICHGPRGDGKGEWSPGLSPQPRSFRAAHFKYRSTPYGKLPLDEDLRRTIRGGRSNTAMGMFTRLSERELDGVIAYLKTFSRKWRNPEFISAPVDLPDKPTWFNDVAARSPHERAGATLFEANCVPCHGAAADGNGPQALGLLDAQGRPIKPADLLAPHLRVGDSETELMRVLMTGLNGTPMLSFAETLTAEELWQLVAHLMTRREKSLETPKSEAFLNPR